jgi:hypothetical protein
MTADTVVVLGWDALDYELLARWNLTDAFGASARCIDTFDNPYVGEPLTREVWPSIITGVTPDEHGIHAATDDAGIEWNNPLINVASTLAGGVVPQRVRSAIGHHLRNRGARVKQGRAAALDDTAHGTVFEGRDSVALSIPSYQTPLDRALDIVVDRTAIWHGVLHTVDADDGTMYEPEVSVAELEQRLLGKARKRYGYVEAAAEQGHDLVFCWFGYLDTVGHLAPAVGGEQWQREHYERAAQWTRDLRERSDATVVCVSDHGLREGTHTHDATYAAPQGTPLPESVLEVRAALDAITPRSSGRDDAAMQGDALGDVEEQLSALGYT